MKCSIALKLALGLLLATFVKGEELESILKLAPQDHPRLFFTRNEEGALRQKIQSDPTLSQAFAHVTNLAEAMLELEPVERKQVGRRLLGVSRTCLKRVTYLSFVYRLTKDERFATKARQEMLAAAGFSDWNPSHFLDVGEMTAALAIGYDWLHEALDATTRAQIKQAILEKGLRTSLPGGSWVRTQNNWNQVCHGGLVLGALALLEDEPQVAAQIIERAVANVPRAMAEYAPDGAYPEGPSYWKYGTTYNVVLIAALESVLGSDLGLSQAAGFMESADYYLHVAGPTGLFFNYSDCGERAGLAEAMYWFAAKRKDPSLLWRERTELEHFLAERHSPGGSSNRLFPFLLLWAKPMSDLAPPQVRHWKADGKTPVGLHRSSWTSPLATFAGLKGGSPSANHAHMDIGSFVLDADGERWAEDLGAQDYNSLESKGINLWGKNQESERWDVFRLNNFSHNTLVVDGKKQQVSGHAPIIRFSDQVPMPNTIVDLTAVYQGQLASAKRGLGLRQDRTVIVQDEIESLEHNTTVRWGMVTQADVSIEGGRQAILLQGKQQLLLRVLSPADAQLAFFDTATPPHEYDAKNPGTRMLGFKVELSSSAKKTLVVWLRPGSAAGDPPAIRPLAEW